MPEEEAQLLVDFIDLCFTLACLLIKDLLAVQRFNILQPHVSYALQDAVIHPVDIFPPGNLVLFGLVRLHAPVGPFPECHVGVNDPAVLLDLDPLPDFLLHQLLGTVGPDDTICVKGRIAP